MRMRHLIQKKIIIQKQINIEESEYIFPYDKKVRDLFADLFYVIIISDLSQIDHYTN